MGISTYGIREGAKIRDNKVLFNNFFSEIFSLNICSTLFSYILLILSYLLIKKLQDYGLLLFIFSFQITLTTIGVDWVYSVFEDYKYITIRTIIFDILGLALLFVFVRNKDDFIIYAIVTVITVSGANILNCFYARKYCKLRLKRFKDFKIHIKPIFVLFISSVAITIYVYSDITMLGFLCSDYEVGLYSISSKIYIILKTVLSSIIVVSIPRLSNYYGLRLFDRFRNTVQSVIDNVAFLLVPCVIGIILLCDEIVLLIGGNEFINSSTSLMILGIALLFCLYGWIFNQCVLLPTGNEKLISIITVITAVVNISANFALMPQWGQNAAAFTTLLAELLMLVICMIKARQYGNFIILNRNLFEVFVGAMCFCLPVYLIKRITINSLISISFEVIISIIVYFTVELLLKNIVMIKYLNEIKHIFKKIKI